MIELTLSWLDLAAIGVIALLLLLAAVLTGAWLDSNVQLRLARRRRREQIALYGADAVDAWMPGVQPARSNGWCSLAPEEGEAA